MVSFEQCLFCVFAVWVKTKSSSFLCCTSGSCARVRCSIGTFFCTTRYTRLSCSKINLLSLLLFIFTSLFFFWLCVGCLLHYLRFFSLTVVIFSKKLLIKFYLRDNGDNYTDAGGICMRLLPQSNIAIDVVGTTSNSIWKNRVTLFINFG